MNDRETMSRAERMSELCPRDWDDPHEYRKWAEQERRAELWIKRYVEECDKMGIDTVFDESYRLPSIFVNVLSGGLDLFCYLFCPLVIFSLI